MRIYRYSTSGFFVGESEAEESLLEEGKHLMPANSTLVPPPVCSDGECPVFRNGAWEVHLIEGDSFLEMDCLLSVDHEEEKRITRENLSVIVEIIEIETLEQHRAIREFALTGDKSRLEQIEARIADLRRQLI